ncbi:hypothetical protein ACMWQW_30505, partial [Escherichia coli]
FILGASALYLRCMHSGARRPSVRKLAVGLAVLLLVLGVASLVQGVMYTLGWLPLDGAHPISPLAVPPLMSVGFVLMALALL